MKTSCTHSPICLLGLLLAGLAVATSARAEPSPRLRPARPELTARTLPVKQRQEIYLRLIENFVGWAEQSGQFVDSDEYEPGGGFFKAAGAGVTWARGNSNLCLGYALLLEEFPQRQEFSIYKIPRKRLEKHLRATIRTLCLSNHNSSRHKPGGKKWGGPAWQPALETIGWAWAVHLHGDHLDDDTRKMAREVICREADHLDKKIPSQKIDNTGSEDCCWNTALLAFAANKYADDPRAARWDELAKRWALNGVSIKSDATSEELIDGRPLREWIVSENVHSDLTIENHGMWSVGYQCASQCFGEGSLAYHVFGRPVPEAYGHHADRMWRDVTSVLFLWDGDIFFPHGQDWSWKTYSTIEYLCWQNVCRGNQAAGALESRALQMIHRRQSAVGTGDLGAAVTARLNFGNQTTKLKRWAFCYLMYKHFPDTRSVSFDEAEKGARGVHVYPFTKTAIHRNPHKCVSVAWHPRLQPVFVLPEGNTTFTDPPFFFPYDRQSGIGKVTVESTDKSLGKKPKTPPPALLEAVPTHAGQGMRVRYKKHWPGGVSQYVGVYSLPSEATVYCTVFKSDRAASVTIGPLFPLHAAAPPGFEKPVEQHRGARWLNMSDHVGFVSVDPLPEKIPQDRFFLTTKKTYDVKPDEWFGRAVVVLYARQPHQRTAERSRQLQLAEKGSLGRFTLSLEDSSGTTVLDVDLAKP
ncbi:MAG: hypothetical protein JW818_16160 [Pirellulales bacterium]|nr:hypothetical protein [Pirellulales bacterium]